MNDIRSCWKQLVLADLAYKLIALIVLTPLAGVLFRVLIALSGKAVTADQDILYFFLGPMGWISFVLFAALWLAIVALEQAALLGILAADHPDILAKMETLMRTSRTPSQLFPFKPLDKQYSSPTLPANAVEETRSRGED